MRSGAPFPSRKPRLKPLSKGCLIGNFEVVASRRSRPERASRGCRLLVTPFAELSIPGTRHSHGEAAATPDDRVAPRPVRSNLLRFLGFGPIRRPGFRGFRDAAKAYSCFCHACGVGESRPLDVAIQEVEYEESNRHPPTNGDARLFIRPRHLEDAAADSQVGRPSTLESRDSHPVAGDDVRPVEIGESAS